MRTLIIGKIWPEPASSAAGSRTLDLIRSLVSAGWEVHFACAAQKSDLSAELDERFGIASHSIQLNDSSFDAWIAQLAPAVVLFDRYMTEEQFGWRVERATPDALRALDTSDLHCLREARREQLKSGGPLDLHNPTALREVASILRCDLTLMISEYEADLLKSHFKIPDDLLAYWPFSLPAPAEGPLPAFAERRHLMMIGSFLHEPNWDAVLWCQREIWPAIRAQLPDAELHIYGSYAPAKAWELHSPKTDFHIKGRADDAVETMQRYRLNLAPLRFGAGLKGKLADAFLAGTPSIATPIAVEAMAGDLDWGSAISGDPAAFASEAVKLYQSEADWTRAQACGYRIARERFSDAQWLDELPAQLERSYARRGTTRYANFIGQMLRHHQHRSTEYMSRWIELKQRGS